MILPSGWHLVFVKSTGMIMSWVIRTLWLFLGRASGFGKSQKLEVLHLFRWLAHTHKQSHTHTNTQTHKQPNTQTHKQPHTQTTTHTNNHTHTHKQGNRLTRRPCKGDEFEIVIFEGKRENAGICRSRQKMCTTWTFISIGRRVTQE